MELLLATPSPTTRSDAAQLRCGSQELRGLFPHTAQGLLYLDHAAISPLSVRVTAALQEHLQARSLEVNTYFHDVETAKACRDNLARLIGAESGDRIAFFMNTSDALNVVAAGLHLRSGDHVLLNDAEFPTNVYPFLHLRSQGVTVEFLGTADGVVTADMVEESIKRSRGRVKVVSLSAVQFLSGYRADLAAIGGVCKRHGVVFVVDAIQALGACAVDVEAMQIDALAAGGQKWLMAQTGIAFLYVSAALQERIAQPTLGWTSVRNPWDFYNYDQPLASAAKRYENGTLNFSGIIALCAALQLLTECGIEHIHQHLLGLTEQITQGLQAMNDAVGAEVLAPIVLDAPHRAGITTARLCGSEGFLERGERVHAALAAHKIAISLRDGCLRYSPHCYSTAEDVHLALEHTRQAFRHALRSV
jgi:selenocysteine lyase/cysteine desulfurase